LSFLRTCPKIFDLCLNISYNERAIYRRTSLWQSHKDELVKQEKD
jgi:hypothetical protein